MTTTVSVERAMAEAKEVQERGIVGIYPLSLVALAAEVEALRKNEERLNWLEQQTDHHLICDLVVNWRSRGRRYPEGMIAAIDAEMLASRPGEKHE